MKKSKLLPLFGLMSLLLGAVVGAVIWALLKIINLGTDLIWFNGTGNIFYNLAVCLAGGLFIGLWQKKFGILPHDTEQVFAIMKKDGKYPYDRLGVISVAVLMPLFFGGALGPEAGLTGLIAGLCYWVGDSLKSRGDKLAKLLENRSSEAIAETGISLVISVVFRTPLAGIVGTLEQGENPAQTRKRLLEKKGRIFLYCMGVIGGLLAVFGLGKLLGFFAHLSTNAKFIEFASGGGLPRFDKGVSLLGSFEMSKVIWFIPLIAAGIILAFVYKSFDKFTAFLSGKIEKYRILSCLIAGLCVAVCGAILPDTLFSGEHSLGILIAGWQNADGINLILTGIVKLLLLSICINFGWRGGTIFPIIYSGSSMAFGIVLLLGNGMDGAFAAAVLISAMYSYISRKPLTAVLIMLLCVPVTYLIPMLLASFVASKIPTPFKVEE